MSVLVVCESLALLLLAVLVAGLLRSHAEILRRLHELGAGYADEAGPAARTSPVAFRPRAEGPGADVSGRTPAGDAVTVGVGRPGERTLLLFLSSGCTRCGGFWAALREGRHTAAPVHRTVVVARDPDEESPARLVELSPPGVLVVQSSGAWDDYSVPGSPFAVVVGTDGAIEGRGTAGDWDELRSLLDQSDADGGAARADRALAAAGILPGDPSLHAGGR